MAEMETVGSETKAPDERCRVCLEIHSETMSLYEEIKIEGFQKETLSKILFDCGNVRADRNDNKPKTICTLCLEKAKEAYKFKLTCEKSNNILQRELIDDLFNIFSVGNNRTFNEIELDIKNLQQGTLFSTIKLPKKNLQNTALTSYEVPHTSASTEGILKKESPEIRLGNLSNVTRVTCNLTLESSSLVSNDVPHNSSSMEKIFEKKLEELKLRNSSVTRDIHKLNSINLSCNICSKTVQSSKLKVHMRIHKCSFCDYFSKKSVTKHMNEEHIEHKKFVCSDCGRRYFKKADLEMHVLTHSKVRQYICEVCGKGTNSKTNLTQHMVCHTRERPFTCSDCGKSFYTKKILEVHQAVHTTIRSFECDVCGGTYKNKPELFKHKVRHQPKRHKCSVCDKLFKTKSELENHVRHVHLGIKNHKCEVCDRRFPKAWKLKDHMKVHTGEKPYICHMCGAAFSQAVSLRLHFKNHHKDSV